MSSITQNKQGLKVLITGSVLQLFLGIIYVWSVFVLPVSEFYAWDVAGVKLTSSYMLSFFVVGILAGGVLQLKIGARGSVLLGGMLLAAGMFATAFVPPAHPWLLYVTYGIIGGFGVGVGYITVVSAAQKWFPQNRGFATGISVCAFGFSTVVFAPLIETLIRRFGLRNTFFILAAAFFIAVVTLFRFIKTPDESASGAFVSPELKEHRQYTTGQALKTKEFYFITLSMMLATAAFFILNPSFKTFAIERGLDARVATAVVMLTGVANAAGRLAVPFLSDKIGRERAALSIIIATGLCSLLLCFAGGALFVLTVAVIAFCYGGFSGVYPVITADYFGVKNVGANYGAVMVGFAASALVFPMILTPIANILVKFIVLASFAAIGAILVVLLIRTGKKA